MVSTLNQHKLLITYLSYNIISSLFVEIFSPLIFRGIHYFFVLCAVKMLIITVVCLLTKDKISAYIMGVISAIDIVMIFLFGNYSIFTWLW